MDWRNRKYYVASFSILDNDYTIEQLRLIDSIRIHNPTELIAQNYAIKFDDEIEPRYSYQYLISCKTEYSDAVEYELRKAQRNGNAHWKEIQHKIKPFSPYSGFPERRCDLNPRKRCNHCGDC
jgi:hypothetical protein